MKLILCCVCNGSYALYAQHRRDGSDYLHWSPTLNEYVHPICFEVLVKGHEKLTQIDMSPFVRLVNRQPTEN